MFIVIPAAAVELAAAVSEATEAEAEAADVTSADEDPGPTQSL